MMYVDDRRPGADVFSRLRQIVAILRNYVCACMCVRRDG